MSRQSKQTEPEVGIFWLLENRLIINSVPITEAETWGRFRNAIGHDKFWDQLRRDNEVPHDVEYDQPPRGRVVYDTVSDRFYLYADKCILARPALVKSIIEKLGLAVRRIELGTDEHYCCTRCMETEDGKA